jgi:Domain of unknown function (DUF4407)
MKTRSVQRALWAIGGFDAETLLREECRAVRAKYSAMGALVLMTALLAACSGGYALWTVFDNPRVAVAVSLIWGGMILSLDRLLVSSTRKIGTLKEYYTGLHIAPPYDSRGEWVAIGARILLACAIGFVVAKPIEARLLRPWVIQRDFELASQRIKDAEASPELTTRRDELTALRDRLKARDDEAADLRKGLYGELDGTSGTLKRIRRRVCPDSHPARRS